MDDLLALTMEVLSLRGERAAFDVLYRGVDDMGDDEADSVCVAASGPSCPLTLDLLVGLLTITCARRSRLPSRPGVLVRTRLRAMAQGMGPSEVDRLLRGL